MLPVARLAARNLEAILYIEIGTADSAGPASLRCPSRAFLLLAVPVGSRHAGRRKEPWTMQTSTITRVITNRENAEKSTGPRTPEGKEISKYNGLRHGLASPLTVLPWEDQSEYKKLYEGFVAEYTPASPTEEALVKQIADSQWKLLRLEQLEQRVFTKLVDQASEQGGPVDPFEALANSLLAPGKGSNVLGLLARYQGTLNRQFHQAVNQLRKVQADRVSDYTTKLKREALDQIAGRADRSQESRLAFHLMVEDGGCITRYLETEGEVMAAELKRDRRAA